MLATFNVEVGGITISGVRFMHDGKGRFYVMPPAFKSKVGWLHLIHFTDITAKQILEAFLKEHKEVTLDGSQSQLDV